VLGLRAGSELAYEELDRHYRATIEKVALKYLDINDVPDAIQQVLFRVFANIHQFQGESSLKRWVLKITYLEIRSLRRKQKWSKGEPLASDAAFAELADPRPGVLETICHREMDEYIESALSTVDQTYRDIIILRHLEGRSYKAIGRILGITPATVLTNLNRGRIALRRALLHSGRFNLKK
jgi:RNA polymerase sigma-70 factor (ECF subfamily)